MIATDKTKKTFPPFPRAKIEAALKTALPKGKPFKLYVAESGIRRLKIVRVVTPAWKTLWAGDRIGKVLKVVNETLTPQEQEHILRFSVLTPEEYRVVAGAPSKSATRRGLVPKTAAAKRKASAK